MSESFALLLAASVAVVVLILWSAFASSCTSNGQCLQGFKCVGARCVPGDPTLVETLRGPRHIVAIRATT